MLCPTCGSENRPGAHFCAQCGTALPAETADRITPSSAPSPAPQNSPPWTGGAASPSQAWEPSPWADEATPPAGPSTVPSAPPSWAGSATPSPPVRTNPLAIVSLVLGILAFPALACYGAGLLLGLAAFIAGLVARSQIARSGGLQKGSGLALAGAIIGASSGVPLACIIVLTLMGSQVGPVFSRITSSLNIVP